MFKENGERQRPHVDPQIKKSYAYVILPPEMLCSQIILRGDIVALAYSSPREVS